MKTSIPPVLVTFALVCVALLPTSQAVVPPPDGGYPGFNTAEGQNALFSLTAGSANTAVGWYSLFSDTTGSSNTATGAGSLLFNTADNNTAFGAAALLFNTTGSGNTATGAAALLNNTEGGANTANGAFALENNTTGDNNTAAGMSALFSNTTGFDNTAIGSGALFINATGFRNTAIGSGALFFNSEGGAENTAIGFQALNHNTEGDNNTATGEGALFSNTTGNGNTAIGVTALRNNTSGSGNIGLGSNAGENVTTADDVICIGADGANVDDSCYIDNIWNQSGGSQAVYVNSLGKLGQMVSAQRFKDEIKSMDRFSEVIYDLKPVSFRYKPEIEPTRPLGFGLIAEEVEKINPDLVSRDKDGKLLSVRYDAVNAMLLNEFLKEHRKNEEQEATIVRQQKQIEALAARLQKVSALVETNRTAPQMVVEKSLKFPELALAVSVENH